MVPGAGDHPGHCQLVPVQGSVGHGADSHGGTNQWEAHGVIDGPPADQGELHGPGDHWELHGIPVAHGEFHGIPAAHGVGHGPCGHGADGSQNPGGGPPAGGGTQGFTTAARCSTALATWWI